MSRRNFDAPQRRSRFQRGQGVYDCESCGRKTRGDGESNSCNQCGQCYELGGQDNFYNDNGVTPTGAELTFLNELLKQIVKSGGDGEAVKKGFVYIWPQGGTS